MKVPVKLSEIKLIILDKPQFSSGSVFAKLVRTKVGETVYLACVAHSMEQATFEWSRNGTVINNTLPHHTISSTVTKNPTSIFATSHLTIQPVERDDAVQYTCRATNSQGSVNQSTVLHVERKFEI